MPALLHPTKNISRFPQCKESMPPFRQLASARWELTSIQRFWDPSWNPRVNCVNIHVHTQRCRHMALSWPCRFPSLTSVCYYHSLYFFTCYCIIQRELFKKWDLIFSSLQYPQHPISRAQFCYSYPQSPSNEQMMASMCSLEFGLLPPFVWHSKALFILHLEDPQFHITWYKSLISFLYMSKVAK